MDGFPDWDYVDLVAVSPAFRTFLFEISSLDVFFDSRFFKLCEF